MAKQSKALLKGFEELRRERERAAHGGRNLGQCDGCPEGRSVLCNACHLCSQHCWTDGCNAPSPHAWQVGPPSDDTW
jgi:hypothetical protein